MSYLLFPFKSIQIHSTVVSDLGYRTTIKVIEFIDTSEYKKKTKNQTKV